IGASDQVLNALKNGDPYIILGRKGADPGTAIEIVGDAALGATNTQEIILEEVLKGKYTQGTIASTRIGPAVEWGTFQRNIKNLESGDIYYFDIYGIDYSGNESILMRGLMDDNVPLESIDPIKYPYLRLRATISDEVKSTPAQLEKWHVLYTGVPEGILTLLGDKDQPLKDIKLKAGEALSVSFSFKNISTKDFADSILVRYTVFNRSRRNSEIKNIKLPALRSGESKDFTININTDNSFGVNDFNVFVNPQIQPEQYYNNNIIDLPQFFEVIQDNINPVLDVAFDGMYIMDGDIVSPNPLISIKVKDENKFLLKKDTTGVDILLKRPCESCTFEKINFSDLQMKWEPASENKDFQVEYQPKNLEDGMYTLKVQAVDGSGNKTGMHPYSVNFEVINKSEITNFYPYPNPFSSSTRFVFTLTGSEIPQEIKIQIMTVTGKIVREITQDELGPIRIGNNLSQYAWNGRDEFGDQLANGVYLYKVIIKNNGQNMDHRDTAADKAFKKGFGKLYLLR
ncbi:MAG: transporter, partial [Bacteroidota bacterium]|nr:transporter [Bacteroidota bacterium]